MRLGILKERKTPPDFRVPLSPAQAASLKLALPDIEIVVESYADRAFSDEDYRSAGIPVVQDLEDCEVILGVKEVPISALLPNKTYFFFSHTIKKQAYNRTLLQEILKKGIRLIDYECIRQEDGRRSLGFGRYAGVVGAYHSLRAWNLRQGLNTLPDPLQLTGRQQMNQELKQFNSNGLKILLTGEGRVATGAREVLAAAGIREASFADFEQSSGPVFHNVDFTRYNQRISDHGFDLQEFFAFPNRYKATLVPFLKHAHMLITGHYWAKGSPNLFSQDDLKHNLPLLQVVGDISCDIQGPVPVTLRASSLQNPYYGVQPQNGLESSDPFALENITVMAVDNLPCALPAEASEDFGKDLLPLLIHFFQHPEADTFRKATLARHGEIQPDYPYLKPWVEGKGA